MGITRYEYQYINTVMEIMQNGFLQENKRTGIATKRIPHAVVAIDCEKECPVLQSRRTEWRSAIHELLWIYQKGSNNIHELKPHIWDAWADPDGSIGKSYGYQISKYNQVATVLENLRKDPSTRRGVLDIWNYADLADMNLQPCVYTSVWTIIDGKLNTLVTSRSCDFLVGGVFNLFQFFVFNNMMARDLGVKPGLLTFVAADCHIYETQFKACSTLMSQYYTVLAVQRLREMPDNKNNPIENRNDYKLALSRAIDRIEMARYNNKKDPDTTFEPVYRQIYSVLDDIMSKDLTADPVKIYDTDPIFHLREDVTSFYDMTVDDCSIENYLHMPSIKFEVAV